VQPRLAKGQYEGNDALRTAVICLLIAACVIAAGSSGASQVGQGNAKEQHVGLSSGDVAPSFKARDQFGKEQDNRTLAGANGTVLLFFRSADW